MENNSNSVSIETVKRYKQTIFTTVIKSNGKVVVTIGTQIMSEREWDTREAAEKWISTRPWELIGNMVIYLSEKAVKRNLEELTKKD